MKYFFLLFSFLISTAFSPFDGSGKDDDESLDINYHEQYLNLQYTGISDTLIVATPKNKTGKVIITSNVAVSNAAGDSVNYIFKDGMERNIINFYFESDYIEKYKTIVFNNNYFPNDEANSELFEFSNNRNVDKRPLADALIIITSYVGSDKQTIWKTDKRGNNLKKLFEIEGLWEWEVDVKNKQIRISRQVNSRIEVKTQAY